MANKVENVEIFSSGTWNGDKYTNSDLDEMVKAFDENKENFRPYLKLGHDESQTLLQQDGLPAAGWIDNLRRVGSKLVADFVDIPQKIMELIKNKAYRKVSSEIFWNFKINDNTYSKALAAVSLLGSNTPAVTNLKDILSMYGLDSIKTTIYNKDDTIDVHKYETSLTEAIMSEENKEVLEEEIKDDAAIEEEVAVEEVVAEEAPAVEEEAVVEEVVAEEEEAPVVQEEEEVEEEVKEDDEEKVAAFTAIQEELIAANKKIEDMEREKFILKLEAANLVAPPMKKYINALMGEDKKTYSIEEKEMSKQDILEELLKLSAATYVNLEEGSEVGEQDDADKELSAEDVEKYAKENDCSFTDAYKKLNK